MSGEPVLLDLNEESDGEEQDFDSWQPDPVDADPSKPCSARMKKTPLCDPCVLYECLCWK